jgi:hypothetical protein
MQELQIVTSIIRATYFLRVIPMKVLVGRRCGPVTARLSGKSHYLVSRIRRSLNKAFCLLTHHLLVVIDDDREGNGGTVLVLLSLVLGVEMLSAPCPKTS